MDEPTAQTMPDTAPATTDPTEEQVAQYGRDAEAIDQLHGAASTPQTQQAQTTPPQAQTGKLEQPGANQDQVLHMPSKAMQRQPIDNPQQQANPATQKASTMYKIAEALAGGPRYTYKVNAETGTMEKTPVPVSGKHLGLAIALEALSGSLTGLAAGRGRGPGAAGAAAFQQAENRGQQRDDRGRAEANANFARGAAIAKTNMEMLRNEQISSQADEQFQQNDVDRSSQEVQDATSVGAVKGEPVTGDQIQAMLKNNSLNVSKDMFIPYKVIPMTDKDGKPVLTPHGAPKFEKLFIQVDPNATSHVDPELWAEAQKYKYPGTVNSSGDPIAAPANLEMKLHMIAGMREYVRKWQMNDSAADGYNNGQSHALHSGTTPEAQAQQEQPVPVIKDPQLASITSKAASSHDLPSGLLEAVGLQESSGNSNTKDSVAGAIGPFQVMPATGAMFKATPDDLRDPQKNADVAAQYLQNLLSSKGNVHDALVAYHGKGPDALGVTGEHYATQVMARIPQPVVPVKNAEPAPAIIKPSEAVAKGQLAPKDIDTIQALTGLPNLLDGNWSTKDIQNRAETSKNPSVTPEGVGRVLSVYGQAIDYAYNQKQQMLAKQKEQTALDLSEGKSQQKADIDAKYAAQSQQYLKDVPDFKPIDNIMDMSPVDAKKALEDQGVPVPPEIGALMQVARYGGTIEKYFPAKTYKGTATISAQDASSYIQNYLNPNYRDTKYAEARRAAEDYGNKSIGKPGGQKIAIDTASQHLNVLKEVADGLKNGTLPDYNAVKNYLGQHMGQSSPVTFGAVAQILGQEVSKVAGGGAALEAELQKFDTNLNRNESPQQIQDVVNKYTQLMYGRMDSLNSDYRNYFHEDMPKMTPNTAKVFGSQGYYVPGWGEPRINSKTGQIGFTKDNGKTITVVQ